MSLVRSLQSRAVLLTMDVEDWEKGLVRAKARVQECEQGIAEAKAELAELEILLKEKYNTSLQAWIDEQVPWQKTVKAKAKVVSP